MQEYQRKNEEQVRAMKYISGNFNKEKSVSTNLHHSNNFVPNPTAMNNNFKQQVDEILSQEMLEHKEEEMVMATTIINKISSGEMREENCQEICKAHKDIYNLMLNEEKEERTKGQRTKGCIFLNTDMIII